ncbi:hypothetical protein Gohar_010489 [Gossypium harknessii]|uniref:Uncharacterized protein n=1 Tax=Gossypium harknessii TaxID=34285 RepID=A0A7J9GR04_9ROSI|nr:hypothetical protein [Gossypium harknessii]
MSIIGMNEQWVTARIKQKGDGKCIPWKSLRDLILAHPNTKKKVNVFALSIYGLVIFPKALGHIDDAVSDLFDRLNKKVAPILVKKVSYQVFSENNSSLKEFVATLGEMTFLKKNRWQFSRVSKTKMLNRGPLG